MNKKYNILKKKLTTDWFRNLRDKICLEFENIENNYSRKKNKIY